MKRTPAAQPTTVSGSIRAAVEQSGLSRYRLSQVSGVAESTISRFMRGGGLRIEAVDRLADALGLQLSKRKATKKR